LKGLSAFLILAMLMGCSAPTMQRVAGSADIETACSDSDPETASTMWQSMARGRANQYLDFVERRARVGELSSFVEPHAWLHCLEPGLEGRIQSRVLETVFRKGSDADVRAAIGQLSKFSSTENFCLRAHLGGYPSDVEARIDAACQGLNG